MPFGPVLSTTWIGRKPERKMKVKSLLAKAAKCKTDADADKLLQTLRSVFGDAKSLAHLSQCNSEACMEESKPFVHFELNQKISEQYITMIRPEIRDGKLVIDVVTSHMLDGLGFESKSWEPVEGCDDTIEATDTQTVAELIHAAKRQAISNHAQLIETVGVSKVLASATAEKCW